MAINYDEGYHGNQVFSGVVELSFPHLGFALIRSSGGHEDKLILCRAPMPGGDIGAACINFPPVGSAVTYRRQKDSDKGFIISYNQQGQELPSDISTQRLHTEMKDISLYDSKVIANILQQVDKLYNRGKQGASSGAAPQDMYSGDAVIMDHSGVGVFVGKHQLTTRASSLSYREYSAVSDKVTDVTQSYQLDTLSNKITKTTALDKDLKAASVNQGLGVLDPEKPVLLTKEEQKRGVSVEYQDHVGAPIYRDQQFKGGLVKGSWKTTVAPIKEVSQTGKLFQGDHPVVAAELQAYNGDSITMSAAGETRIKTSKVTGLKEFGEASKEAVIQDAQAIVDGVPDIKLSQDGTSRILQLQKLLSQADARSLVKGMIGSDIEQLLENGVFPYGDAYDTYVNKWQDGEQGDQNRLADAPSAEIQDTFTKKKTKYFNNTSIITQDPDGTITLKDGWGSQITMSHGNIYISSALDTFIRPGRDLITMVPRNVSCTADKNVEIAAKKDIKLGAQGNAALSSAISGKEGYTVIQNRSKKASQTDGIAIRSNGNMSITASQDMHIGINDKKTTNADTEPTEGKGSLFIEAGDLRLESRGQLRMAGQVTGIYSIFGKQGIGLQMTGNSITAIAPIIDFDTEQLRAGKFDNTYTVKTGLRQDVPITLMKGSGSFSALIKGAVRCRDIICGGSLMVSGQLAADNYIVWNTQGMPRIPGTEQDSINLFRQQVQRVFSAPLKAAELTFPPITQMWYNDAFICNKQLSFTVASNMQSMPMMCWQLNPAIDNYKNLQGVVAVPTGKEEQQGSYSFPGKDGWQNISLLSVDSEYNIDDSKKLTDGYVTNTRKE